MGEDVLRVLEAHKVHWAFYAFGEDAWEGMDDEPGDAALPWTYGQDVEAGKVPTPNRTDSPQFAPILNACAPPTVDAGVRRPARGVHVDGRRKGPT